VAHHRAPDPPGYHFGIPLAFIVSFDELTIALFTTGGLSATLPKQMWDDAVLKVSPLLAAVSTVLLIFISAVILLAEWFRRRSVRAEVQAAATRYDA
jgi:ABC-type spermidine/putrescine transport system permease subunit II